MAESPHWMPLDVADYIKDTRHLSTLEHGAYLLLLMSAWTSEGALPSDEKRLARMAGMSAKEWRHSGPILLDFFALDGDCYRHKRVDAELAKAAILIEKKRAAGKASAAARAQQVLNRCSTGEATHLPTDGQQSANQEQEQGSGSKEPAAKPASPRKELVDRGVRLLTAAGIKDASARSFIGQCLRDSGEAATSAAFHDAERLNVPDPRAYVRKCLQNAAAGTTTLYASIDRTFGAAGAHQ